MNNPDFRCRCCTTPIPFSEKNTEHGKKEVCFQCFDDDLYLQEISPKYAEMARVEENQRREDASFN